LTFGDAQRRVSSHHAELVRCDDQYVLRDLGSTNGTMINGRRIVVSELNQDDMIEFGAGGPLLRFALETDAPAALEAASLDPSRPRASDSSFTRRITTRQAAARHRASPGATRNNSLLIGAVLAAMLVGAVAGIIFSRTFSRRDDEQMRLAEIDAVN